MGTCTTEYLKGQGSIWIASRVAGGAINGAWVAVGDTDSLEVSVDRSYVEHYESCSGSRNQTVRAIDQTTWGLSMNTFNFDKDALARALVGTATAVSGASVTDEAFTVFGSGTTIFTAHPDISTVVITNNTPGAPLTVDTHYTVDALQGSITFTTAGLALLTTSGSNKTGLIDYAYAAYDKIEANMVGEQEYAVRFSGINTVNNEAVIAEIHRVSLSPASVLSLIGSDVAAYEMTGAVLPDSTKGSGVSQYMRVNKTK
jgi:hypothetical protein